MKFGRATRFFLQSPHFHASLLYTRQSSPDSCAFPNQTWESVSGKREGKPDFPYCKRYTKETDILYTPPFFHSYYQHRISMSMLLRYAFSMIFSASEIQKITTFLMLQALLDNLALYTLPLLQIFQCPPCGLKTAGHIDLSVDVIQMLLYCVNADRKFLGNLMV